MKEEDIPDLNLFMMCPSLNEQSLAPMPAGYSIRSCHPEEFAIWKAFPFETPEQVKEYDGFMTHFFHEVYGRDTELFFKNTLFACNTADMPVATCSSWKAYGKFQSIHWWKTLKGHEGKGIGRALMSVIMKRFTKEDYPVFLHTQPGSFRAVKLYADFGFHLLSGDRIGNRSNDLHHCLPILQEFLPRQDFDNLKIAVPPRWFLEALSHEGTHEF
jgi:ribosomal protein S18 acetylase RimI-like enzyme